MDLKLRLQRMLQIVEESERVGALSDIERDILLAELREAYAELKFGQTENGKLKTENEADEKPAAVELPIAPSVTSTPIEEEVEEDFAKMAAITPTETSYLKTSALGIFKSRIPWLLILMISATFSSTILNFFEANLAAVFVLFVPMLMDTGGNSGSQASVTLIRGISLGEVEFRDVLRVLWKEIRVGMLCGLALGAVTFGKVLLVDRLIMSNPEVTVGIAAIVALTLALTILIAKIVGSMLPMLAAKIGFDPAVMASPFITTIVDALSLIVYYFIASSMLTGIL